MNFKVAIRPKPKRKDGTVNVKVRVTHDGKTRYIGTDYYVLPKYFDKTIGQIKAGGEYTQEKADRANTKLQIKIGGMAEKAVNQKRHLDIKSLLTTVKDERTHYDVFALLEERIKKYEKLGNLNYRDSIKSTKALLERFEGSGLLPFENINCAWLMSLENWMRLKGLKPNGIGVRMRNIRTVYNQAITLGYVDPSTYPFREYKIPKEPTRKRNLTADELAIIASKEIKDPLMDWARAMFMLSFFLIGINMKDLFYLKKVDEGRIYYIRSKGKKSYSIKVWPEAQEIIDRYPGKKYLLNTMDRYSDYRTATKRINYKLKKVAGLCKIDKEISTYWVRHSWATIGRTLKISKDDLSRGLGHQRAGMAITEIYIDEEQEVVDSTNRAIIDFVVRTPLFEQGPLSDTGIVCLLDQ